jgi:pyruvate formate-lyase/glycerol dehydratase family glycyl radical enzyme
LEARRMNERVAKLREQSIQARPSVSAERAKLLTDFYKKTDAEPLSEAVRQALALEHILENKAICINEGELIVGERGPAPKATPTYPEVCCHTLEDLDTLNSRKKTPYSVSEETRRIYEQEIIPYWSGRTMRDRIFSQMTEQWKAAYSAGVFTEFMEQRSPGHAVLDDKIYHRGLLDLKKDIRESLRQLDHVNDPEAYSKQEELKAMAICADALTAFAKRHADKAAELAKREIDPQRRCELERIAEICSRVPANAPRDFWEALQMYWFVHLGVITEFNTWDAYSPGQLDQHLYPFYKKGLEDGTLTQDQAKELLQCFWIKFNNHPAPPKVGVTAEESGTYTDFAQISLGGVTGDGSDGVNDLTYLILEVIEEMRLVQPSASLRLSKLNPDSFLTRAGEIVRTGFGQPSIFNADLIVEELKRQGKTIADARAGGPSGCVEISAFGKEACILTGYLNMPKVFEIALNDGVDPRTGRRTGIQTGDPRDFDSFDQLLGAYRKQLQHFVNLKIKGNDVIERLYAEHMPSPMMSLLVDDCLEKGRDYHDGGARYNTNYIQGVGLGSLTDAMTAVKYHVYDKKSLKMQDLSDALACDFEGHEKLRQVLKNKTPKYGNDDDYADSVMQQLFEAYFDAIDGRPNTKGGEYRINLLPTTVHIYFGSVVGATPDGRRAGRPLSEGVSPVQGADTRGPTAVMKSVSKMDHVRTGGTLLNMKFLPQVLEGDSGLEKWAHLVRSYCKLNGHHVQFNVVDADTLRAAQEHPEDYRDLIVRVAGYSDYFCDVGKELQDEIIARTAHGHSRED